MGRAAAVGDGPRPAHQSHGVEPAVVTLDKAHGITTAVVEQNIEFARRASDSFAIMERGQVVAEGPVKNLTDDLVHKHMAAQALEVVRTDLELTIEETNNASWRYWQQQ